jgi:hypothetical protein
MIELSFRLVRGVKKVEGNASSSSLANDSDILTLNMASIRRYTARAGNQN